MAKQVHFLSDPVGFSTWMRVRKASNTLKPEEHDASCIVRGNLPWPDNGLGCYGFRIPGMPVCVPDDFEVRG